MGRHGGDREMVAGGGGETETERERGRLRMPVWWEDGFLVLLDLTGHFCFNDVMSTWNRSVGDCWGQGWWLR